MKLASRSDGRAPLRVLAQLLDAEPTCPVSARPGTGADVDSAAVRLGDGAELFSRAVTRLTSWEMHRRAGLRVWPAAETAELGSDVVLGYEMGPVRFFAPCRVAYVVDSPRRKGFGYVTLPGHPEVGVEEFVMDHHDDDAVWFSVRAVSRPASLLTKIGAPIGRRVQRRVTGRYLTAMAADARP